MTPLKQTYNEAALVGLLKKQDVNGLEYLYDHYSDALYGIIVRIVRSSDIADEVLQDAFLRIWNKVSDYDAAKGKLFTWMLNISRNLAIDKIRSKEIKNSDKTDGIEQHVTLENSETVQSDVDNIGIKEQLKALPEEQIKIIDLIYYKGYSHSEISKEFDIPLGTVKTRARSALIKLRKIMPKDFG